MNMKCAISGAAIFACAASAVTGHESSNTGREAAPTPPTVTKADVESVALFKNGLAVVTRTMELPGPGEYVLEHVPVSVHGTFWLESDAELTARMITRDVEVPLDETAGTNLREELMGRTVTVRLHDPAGVTIHGEVIRLEGRGSSAAWDRRYESHGFFDWRPASTSRGPVAASAYLILDDGDTRHYINPATIASLTVHDPVSTMVRRLPVLEVAARAPASGNEGPYHVTMTYLAKGITWAPAYLAQLDDSAALSLRQQATIRNELETIEDAEFYLISGFPSIEFSHVDSLASPTATIAAFFSQLNRRIGTRHAARRDIISQVAVTSNIAGFNPDDPIDAVPDGEGVDLHYQFAGRHSLPVGASMVINVVDGQGTYERMVEWTIPDTRDARGRVSRAPSGSPAPDPGEDGLPWDVVRFRNPLGIPMTTAPMMILDGMHFAGQRMSYWTNSGERCTVPITRALSIRTRYEETEREDSRRPLRPNVRNSYLVDVDGLVEIGNHRAEPVTIVVRRQFSGELIEADGSPRTRLLEEGVYSYNKRNELIWTITLEPGEVRPLTYAYTVAVRP